MASDAGENYMECLFKFDTSEGWQKSVTLVLTQFQDLSFEIDSPSGLVYVKGKTVPQKILLKLITAGKHATILWISYGMPRDNQQPQAQFLGNVLNQWNGHETYYHPPYNHPWYDNTNYYLPQSGINNHMQPHLGHEPGGHGGERRKSIRSHHNHCPVHSRHRHSPVSSDNGDTPPQYSSPPFMQAGANGQVMNQPTSHKPKCIFIKKVTQKFLLPCYSLCFKSD